ncbi:MAG: Translation elongation factor EFTs/EF1B dimerization, elongation factor Ts [Candidatus Adlerbacteria bacterium]|nr:Translation elongation factor EFTs/EF1B dimerization, elongation factor Ts [Candidatus Adlerbacteria bacterium]
MDITPEQVKQLRDQTGISVMECKKALEASEGDMDKALAFLRERAAASVGKKADRELGAGAIASYVHNTAQSGALVLLACETDFVSKNEEFVAMVRDIAMHATAMRPASVEELLTQPFIKDGEKTVADLISAATQKFGERVEVTQLSVFSVR